MSIAFQNGFLVGMATKGLTVMQGGETPPYKPLIWNDAGVYSHFYMDFLRPLQTFSLGMLKESLVLLAPAVTEITGFTKLGDTLYKVFTSLAGAISGMEVLHKPNGLLTFANGKRVDPFNVLLLVSGLPGSMRLAYAYEQVMLTVDMDTVERVDIMHLPYSQSGIADSAAMPSLPESGENVNISYWST